MTIMSDDVVIAGVVSFGDSDVVVRCFARDAGRVSAFARGARASRKRFPGLQAPAFGRATWKSRAGSDMLQLVELDVDTRLMDLGSDLRAFGFCGYVAELIERFVPEGAPQPELFDVVTDTMSTIAQHGARAVVLRAFELQLLNVLGVLPDLGDVVDDPGAPCVAYDPVRGHLLARPGPQTLDFADDARQAALFLLQGDARSVLTLSVDDEVLRQVSRLFSSWLRRQNVRLRSLEVLRSIT
ncbi:MAG: DNA repair protein RecO [Deltaproteobacteria bacterium]|nr:DNA repair protein RecO [Deltaproteobacteria bacterium]